MRNEELETVKAAAEGTAAGLTRSLHEIVSSLLGPAAQEIGLELGDTAIRWRLRRNALKVGRRTMTILDETGVRRRAVLPNILVPLLENASLETDEDLQERWALLLVTAADADGPNLTRAFVEILKELTPADARLLEWIARRSLDFDANHPADARDVD